MSDPGGPPRPGGLPPPRLRPWAGLPWIWAVPVIALVIAAWLGLRTISDRGPVITISFANAEGIELGRNEAARTTIRYKNVELGRVASLDLLVELPDDVEEKGAGLDGFRGRVFEVLAEGRDIHREEVLVKVANAELLQLIERSYARLGALHRARFRNFQLQQARR